MGIVITVNGRMGATVGCVLLQRNGAELRLTWNSFTLHSLFSHACHLATYFSYFVVVSRCVLAIVWLGLVCPTNHFITPGSEANCTQCPNHDWRSMHGRLAHSHLAKFCQHPQSPYPLARASPRQECVALCSTSCFSFPSYVYLTPRYGPANHPPAWTRLTLPRSNTSSLSRVLLHRCIFLAIFGSTLHKAGGTISHSTVITKGTTLSGSALAWAFFASK